VLTCARCGGDLPEGAARCEHCGHAVAPEPAGPPGAPVAEASGRKLIAGLGCGMLAVMLALMFIVVLFGLLLGGLVGAVGARP
jgi:hypothetical protein